MAAAALKSTTSGLINNNVARRCPLFFDSFRNTHTHTHTPVYLLHPSIRLLHRRHRLLSPTHAINVCLFSYKYREKKKKKDRFSTRSRRQLMSTHRLPHHSVCPASSSPSFFPLLRYDGLCCCFSSLSPDYPGVMQQKSKLLFGFVSTFIFLFQLDRTHCGRAVDFLFLIKLTLTSASLERRVR